MGFQLDHVHIKVPDPKATMDHFVGDLGAVVIEELGPGMGNGYKINLHGLVLNITGFSPSQQREQRYGIEHIAIETDQIGETVDGMLTGGATLLEEVRTRDGRRVCFVEDADGLQFELMEKAAG